MTFGTYLAIVELAKAKNAANSANVAGAESLADANALLAKVARLNFADELIVADINNALTSLNALD